MGKKARCGGLNSHHKTLVFTTGLFHSFYRRKATFLKAVAPILRDVYADDIPASVETLCALPGVGPKMAHICMRVAWNEVRDHFTVNHSLAS